MFADVTHERSLIIVVSLTDEGILRQTGVTVLTKLKKILKKSCF